MPLLKDHLLAWILCNNNNDQTFTDQDCSAIRFQHDHIYKHQTFHINYTSYNMCYLQETLNPYSEHCNIMVLADEEPGVDAHPYWYAHIIGIFHVNIFHIGPDLSTSSNESWKMDVLWVCWFGHDANYQSGFKACHLPWIGFFDGSEDCTFGQRLDFWTQIKLFEQLTSCLHSHKGVLKNFWVL